MDKIKTKWLIVLFLILNGLFIFVLQGIITGIWLYVVGVCYCLVIILLIIRTINGMREERRILDNFFNLYFDIYELVWRSFFDYKREKMIDFLEFNDKLSVKVDRVRDILDKYKKSRGSFARVNEKMLGLEVLDLTKANVAKMVDNDKEIVIDFFIKIMRILEKLLIIIDKNKFSKRLKELDKLV